MYKYRGFSVGRGITTLVASTKCHRFGHMTTAPMLKAGGLCDLTNARFFASSAADWLGFMLDPLSPKALTVEAVRDIQQWIATDQWMGEMPNRSPDEVIHLARELSLKGVEVPYALPTAEIKSSGLEVWKTLSLAMPLLPMALDTNHCDVLVVEMAGWQEKIIEHPLRSTLMEWIEELPVVLSIPPDVQWAETLWNDLQPAGFNLQLAQEIRPGVQSFTPVFDFLDWWENIASSYHAE